MHPSVIGDIKNAIVKELNKRILVYRPLSRPRSRWDTGNKGMLLSYRDVRLAHEGRGQLHDENPYVHFEVKFIGEYFHIEVGSYLSPKPC